MRPSPGDRICGEVQVDEEAAPDVGGHVFGPTLHATLSEDGDRKVWLSVVERNLVPSQVDVSSFMAGMGELLSAEMPGLVPIRLVDREADFCVVGYEVLPGAVPLRRRLESTESTGGLVARVAVEVARGLAHLHGKGRVHGALSPGNVVLWRDGVGIWQHGLAAACSSDALAPAFRSLGADVVAPEVRAGSPPAAPADVYAWGAIVASLATDTLGAEAVAAAASGSVDAGLITPIVTAALSEDPGARPADGLALLRCIAEAPADGGAGSARHAEVRLLAGRYVQEVESGGGSGSSGKRKRRQFVRTATELYPPGLEPIAGTMVAPDEPEPDPFTVPTDAVAPPEVQQEQPERVPTPAPMQITARRIEDDSARQFNPDALTPPDGARVTEMTASSEPDPEQTPRPVRDAPSGGVSLPPLVVSPGIEDDFTPEPTRMPLTTTPAEERPVPASSMVPPPPVVPPPPMDSSAPIPPPPQHDDMSPEDSGFGLSMPVAETLDARGRREDSVDDVAAALTAATSSESLPTVDLDAATAPEPEPEPELELDLDLPARPEKKAKKKPKPAAPRAGHTPAPIPIPSAKPPARDSPPPQKPPEKPEPVIAPGDRIELDVETKPAAKKPAAARSEPARPIPAAVRELAPAEARGPRGSTMAAVIGFGATILAVGLTVPVAQERGGLSVLLGQRESESAVAGDTDGAAETDDASEAQEEPAAPPPPPTVCPDDTVALPKHARVCVDVGEYPGLREYPKTGLSHAEAADACAARGRRLCTAQEWREACRGGAGRRLPYAGARKEGHCNDALEGVAQNLSRGGARETCATPEGIFDLVGNAGEWVADGTVRGGDATTKAASCNTKRKPGKDAREPAIGFRCCVDLVDPEDVDGPSGAGEG